jgi:hypothetical protein
MAFDLRDAILVTESTVIGFDGLATHDAIDGLRFPEEHCRLLLRIPARGQTSTAAAN